MGLSIAKFTVSFKEDNDSMKTLKVDILLFHPEKPQELRVEVRIPVADAAAQRLLEAQRSTKATLELNALYNLAGAVGYLNGLRGVPLRVREVEQ